MASEQVTSLLLAVVPQDGAELLPASDAYKAEITHQPGDGAAGRWVVRMDTADLLLQLGAADRPGTGRAILGGVVGARSLRPSVRGCSGHGRSAQHDNGQVLGRIALRGLDFDDGTADVAYWVLPAARGAGIASRALTTLTVWALDEIGFQRLHLDHSTRNHASCRVATKSGHLLEGTKRSAAVHDDGRHDMHLHARIRGD